MMLGGHAQHFHGDVFQGQQQLGAIGEQQIDVPAGEFHRHVRRFHVAFGGLHVEDLVSHMEARHLEGRPQESVDARTIEATVYFRSFTGYFLTFFFLGGSTDRAASSATAVWLKNHCCPMLTRLLVK